ncbi:IclR family transcriptional regulator C-terminal domain-containing protein [Streptomyces sp. NPDC001594]|uniref:IclR family transcriptional regulator domain-containing protein n=1 Tax=Streptomyces sp. NPDC001594 TaxID=3364590 RepID=UPI0036CB8969
MVWGTLLRVRRSIDVLRETLTFLRDEVGAAVYVAAYTDGEVSITQYADSPTAPAVHEWVDFREAAHASAVGKALLVQLNHAERRDHLGRHHMEAFTPHTITSQEELFAELDTRDPGEPLLDLQEYALGTVCAAVPIRTGTDPECGSPLPSKPGPAQARPGRPRPAQRSDRRPPGPPRRRQQPATTHHAEHPLRGDPPVADSAGDRRAGERRLSARAPDPSLPRFACGRGRASAVKAATGVILLGGRRLLAPPGRRCQWAEPGMEGEGVKWSFWGPFPSPFQSRSKVTSV